MTLTPTLDEAEPSTLIFMKVLYRGAAVLLAFLCLVVARAAVRSRASTGGGSNNCAVGAGTMLDVFMLAIGLGFFVLAVGYTYACDRL